MEAGHSPRTRINTRIYYRARHIRRRNRHPTRSIRRRCCPRPPMPMVPAQQLRRQRLRHRCIRHRRPTRHHRNTHKRHRIPIHQLWRMDTRRKRNSPRFHNNIRRRRTHCEHPHPTRHLFRPGTRNRQMFMATYQRLERHKLTQPRSQKPGRSQHRRNLRNRFNLRNIRMRNMGTSSPK